MRFSPLPHLLAERAEDRPHDCFMIEVDGKSVTYHQFDELVRRYVAQLAGAGVVRGEPVATMVPPSVDAIALWVALSWVGAVEVPVNSQYRGRILDHMLEISRARRVVVDNGLSERRGVVDGLDARAGTHLLGLDRASSALVDAVGAPLPHADAAVAMARTVADDDLAAIVFTSGTTGLSKGVQVPWSQMTATAVGKAPFESMSRADVFYSPFPLFHSSGRSTVVLMAILGGSVVVRERFSGSGFWSDISRYGCTTTLLLGSMANVIGAAPEAGPLPLRTVLMVPIVREVERALAGLGVSCHTTYNSTEISCPIVGPPDARVNWRSCGRVRPGYECRIIRADGRPALPGEPGELQVRPLDPGLHMRGYLLAEGRSTDNPSADGWFATGDSLYSDDDGNYFFAGRLKDYIRRRGENISAFEVERELLEHPGVSDCAVVGVPAEVGGEDEITAYVVREAGAGPAAEDLISFVAERLPSFMVPRHVQFRAGLPMTETGKVAKQVLREEVAGG